MREGNFCHIFRMGLLCPLYEFVSRDCHVLRVMQMLFHNVDTKIFEKEYLIDTWIYKKIHDAKY